MTSEVLYRKWRPQTLAEVMGQESVTTTLLNAVRNDRVGHAYLFCGPRGTGKTSTGRILAKAVNCLESQAGEPCNVCEACVSISEGRCLDVIEIDAASNRGVDDIRLLRERVNYAAGTVRRKVYIVDEVHMLTDAASNALLKTLEEPPPHVMFILATTEFHKVLPTIVSRCQSFHFRRLALNAIAAKLKVVCEREGIEAEDETLVAISRSAGGSLRDAENILQQLLASHGKSLLIGDVRKALGIGDEAYVLKLIAGLGSRDLAGGLRVLHEVSDEGVDMRNFGRHVVSTLRDIMLVQSGCEDILDGGAERLVELRNVAHGATIDSIARAARRFAETTARDAAQPLLSLELALVDCVVGTSTEQTVAQPVDRGSSAKRGVSEPTRTDDARYVPGHSKTRGHAVSQRVGHPQTASVPRDADVEPGVAQATVKDDTPSDTSASSPVDTTRAAVVEQSSQGPTEGAEESPVTAQSAQPAVPEEFLQGELGRVRASWKEYVDSLRGLGSTGNLDAFLRSACEPVAVKEDVLVLRFSHEFHKSKVEDPKYRHVVEERLQEFYGRPFTVTCVLEGPMDAPAEARAPQSSPESLVDAALRMGARPRNRR